MIIDDGDLAKHIEDAQATASSEWQRLEYFERYFRGDQEPPYTPPTSTREYKALVPRSITNLTRLVINTMVQRCIIDGYRASATDVENAAPWEWWQANGMDSRQKALWEETGKHGYASMLVLPASFRDAAYDHRTAPIMQPVSPREWYVHMDSWADDWPQWAIRRDGHDPDKWWVVDDERLRVVRMQRKPNRLLTIDRDELHGFETCPFIPFRNAFDLTRAPIGEIEPIIPIQDRLNQTVFDLLVATTYSSAPQKWIAGMAVPTDEATGQPIIDLKAFAKSVWLSDDPTTKFGSLPEANLSNIVTAIDSTLRVYGLMSQTPPHYLLGDLVNLPLALDTPVPTPTGMSTVGELRQGDQVLSPDGHAIDVTAKTPVFLGHDCYRLRFDDGAEVVADADHRWVTTRFLAPDIRNEVTGDVTTEQIAKSLRCGHYIDVAEPFDGPEVPFDIPPYVLGLWLADGDHINGVITKSITDTDELVEHLRSEGEIVTVRPYADDVHVNCRLITVSYDHGRCPQGHERPRGTHDVSHHCTPCAALRYRLKRYGEPMPPAVNVSFVKRLKRNGLWKNKHIPEAYFAGSLKQRLALLQGIMDGDGSIGTAGTVTITNHREVLAHDIARLVRSVGMKVRLRQKDAPTFDKLGTVPQWRMSWSARNFPVFRLARKLDRQRTTFDGTKGRSALPRRHYITACDPVPSVPVQCVTVDSAEHLFLVTEHRITTGNSAEALLAADTTLAKKIQDHQMIWGEAVESAFRLAAVAAGDTDAADDESSQVMWRATEPRSIAQQVDALGKMATMLGIPVEALWEQVPGVTSTDLELWRAMQARDRLRAATQAALTTPPPPPPGTAVEPAPANPTTAATQLPRTA